ncbi:hypothetical protein [Winogradskyella sp. J14-2]|uniref:DUF7793 family protein n=1 Tax=Winogradskyella sp. J14-2 TaxID=1936080 RepID=UPI0012FCD1C2|nr:hypothetical protein [Winogradskyella sp. J14-2]
MPITTIYDFETVRLWIDEGILFCQFLNTSMSYKLMEKDVVNYLKTIKQLTEGRSVPMVVDLRNVVGSFSVEAVKLISNNEAFQQNTTRQAFVINTLQSKLLVLAFKRIYEPHKPFRIFEDVNKAMEYCAEDNDTGK